MFNPTAQLLSLGLLWMHNQVTPSHLRPCCRPMMKTRLNKHTKVENSTKSASYMTRSPSLKSLRTYTSRFITVSIETSILPRGNGSVRKICVSSNPSPLPLARPKKWRRGTWKQPRRRWRLLNRPRSLQMRTCCCVHRVWQSFCKTAVVRENYYNRYYYGQKAYYRNYYWCEEAYFFNWSLFQLPSYSASPNFGPILF
jgi:hypothetical protein